MGSKARRADHAERVVGEGPARVERRADAFLRQVGPAVERIEEVAEAVRVEVDGQSVDGKVAAALVVVERAVFDKGFARIAPVTLAPGRDEFQHEPRSAAFLCRKPDSRRAEVFVDVYRAPAQPTPHGSRQANPRPRPDGDEVDVGGRAPEQHVAHHPADGVRLDAQTHRFLPYLAQDGGVGLVF